MGYQIKMLSMLFVNPSAARPSFLQDPPLSVSFSRRVWLYRGLYVFIHWIFAAISMPS